MALSDTFDSYKHAVNIYNNTNSKDLKSLKPSGRKVFKSFTDAIKMYMGSKKDFLKFIADSKLTDSHKHEVTLKMLNLLLRLEQCKINAVIDDENNIFVGTKITFDDDVLLLTSLKTMVDTIIIDFTRPIIMPILKYTSISPMCRLVQF